jgi:tetratricopeptide (TPR) repeat protein
MQNLAKSFEELIPVVYSENKFQNPLNKQDVEKKIENFRASIHDISPEKARMMYGTDPLMLRGLDSLKKISSRSLSYFQLGKTHYAQNLLKQSAKYCFQCHTRVPAGPEQLFWSKFNIDKFQLEPHEKAQIFVAMRQYDEAKKVLTRFVQEPSPRDNLTLLREQDIKYYLLIAIRGQSQFEEANLFISQQSKNEKLSQYFRESLNVWKRDLTLWAKQFPKVSHNLAEAKKALGLGKKKNFEIEEAHFVRAIVAALMIHEGLAVEKDPAVIADSYYHLGRIYEFFTVGGFWDLSDFYYEMCVETQPHSEMATRCVNRLKESLVIKNSGTSGFILPDVETNRLKELEKQALPAKK